MLIDIEIMAENRNPRWRPFAILDFRKSDFWELEPLGLLIFHLGTKFGAKMLIDAEIYSLKSKSKMTAVRHLGFSKIWFQSTGTPWAADFPSPYKIWYKIWYKNVDRRRNYGLKSKYKMAAVRHLGFVTSSYRTTHEVYSLGLHLPFIFYANPMHSFEDMTIWIFL